MLILNPHSPTQLLLLLIGGSALLLYGVKSVTEAVERACGARLRLMMMTLASCPLAAFASGLFFTLLTQSSTATASVMIEMVSAQLVPLAAAVIMLLGAAVGSTLAVQLLAFHITDYALEFLGLAAVFALMTRTTKLQDAGRGLFSFALMLVGLAMIDASSAPIAGSSITNALLQTLAQSPLMLLLLGVLLASVFVSSIAAIGIVMVLAGGSALPLTAALTVTLGANLGTTLTPLFIAINQGNAIGRRLGVIYITTRFIGVTTAMLLLNPLAAGLTHLLPNPAAQVAIAHLGFNLILAVLFIPLASRMANFSTTLLPEPETAEKTGSRYLDPRTLKLPAVALGQAMREVLRMADLATEMLQLSIRAFKDGAKDLSKRVGTLDDQLDDLEIAIKHYLIQLNDEALTEEQTERELMLLHVSTELEAIGDIIDHQLMRLARRKRRKQIALPQSEWKDIVTYHGEVSRLLQQVLAGLASQDLAIADEVLSQRQWLNQLRREMHNRHLHSLTSADPMNLDASAIHLETVNAMSRILFHTCSIAQAMQGDL
jgi:phosphate:Na+ symporter